MPKDICNKYKRSPKLLTRILVFAAIILLGSALGYTSEYLEYNTYTTVDVSAFDWLTLVLNGFSVWIFIATVIAYFSWGPLSAGIQTFCFFVAMCVAYFIPKHQHYGYRVDIQLLFWLAIAFISIGAAVLIWFSKADKRWCPYIKALPISAIIAEFSYIVVFWYDRYGSVPGSVPDPFKYLLMPERMTQLTAYLIFVIALLLLLASGKQERLRVGISALLFGGVLSAVLILLF